jgi:uncharacterized protein
MRTFFVLFLADVLLLATGSGVLAQQLPALHQLPPQMQAPPPAPPSSEAPARPVQPAVADGPPSPDQVRKLLGLLRVRDELQITLDAMKQQVKAGAAQTFSDKVPDPTPEQLKSVNFIVDDVFSGLSLDDLIKDLVPVYQRHLTRSDVRALIAFYSSPPGQKILREQPAMIKESMQVAGAAQQRRMEVLLATLEVRMQQLINQEQTKPASERK